MKRPVLAAIILLGLASAVFAQPDFDALRNKFMHAGPTTRQKLRQMVLQRYPDLPTKVVGFVSERYPNLPTQAALARMETLRSKHPEAIKSLPAKVMEDIHAKHPRLVAQTALTYWNLVAEKYPQVPSRMGAERRSARDAARKQFIAQYPHLIEDVLTVVKDKAPRLPAAIRKDVSATLYATDPSLPVELALDAARVLAKYPDVREKVMSRHGIERLRAMREALEGNPRCAVELWTMIDQKYADRAYKVGHAVVKMLGEQHGEEIYSLAHDVVAMVDQKYPRLPYDIALQAIKNGQQAARNRESLAPGFTAELAAALQAKNGSLLGDVVDSVDRHAPGLRDELRAAARAKFPTVRDEVGQFIRAQWPGFLEQVTNL